VTSARPTGPFGGATGPLGGSMVPPAPKRTLSGQHPAVTAYRDKLDSIVEGVEEQGADLDKTLAEYLEAIRTPPPPAMPKDPLEGPLEREAAEAEAEGTDPRATRALR
jgi:hypothetical protein